MKKEVMSMLMLFVVVMLLNIDMKIDMVSMLNLDILIEREHANEDK